MFKTKFNRDLAVHELTQYLQHKWTIIGQEHGKGKLVKRVIEAIIDPKIIEPRSFTKAGAPIYVLNNREVPMIKDAVELYNQLSAFIKQDYDYQAQQKTTGQLVTLLASFQDRLISRVELPELIYLHHQAILKGNKIDQKPENVKAATESSVAVQSPKSISEGRKTLDSSRLISADCESLQLAFEILLNRKKEATPKSKEVHSDRYLQALNNLYLFLNNMKAQPNEHMQELYADMLGQAYKNAHSPEELATIISRMEELDANPVLAENKIIHNCLAKFPKFWEPLPHISRIRSEAVSEDSRKSTTDSETSTNSTSQSSTSDSETPTNNQTSAPSFRRGPSP